MERGVERLGFTLKKSHEKIMISWMVFVVISCLLVVAVKQFWLNIDTQNIQFSSPTEPVRSSILIRILGRKMINDFSLEEVQFRIQLVGDELRKLNQEQLRSEISGEHPVDATRLQQLRDEMAELRQRHDELVAMGAGQSGDVGRGAFAPLADLYADYKILFFSAIFVAVFVGIFGLMLDHAVNTELDTGGKPLDVTTFKASELKDREILPGVMRDSMPGVSMKDTAAEYGLPSKKQQEKMINLHRHQVRVQNQ
jgi:hypothetical protein